VKYLHLSHHNGCVADLAYVARKLDGISIDYMQADWNYNVGPERATQIWNERRGVFERYDGIITSDTAPLSRIFLQNGWAKPLIIWICTRFDYTDQATNDCHFPDPDYYKLFSEALNKPNVRVISYTAYEYIHARNRGVAVGDQVIKPTGMGAKSTGGTAIPADVDRVSTFFIPPYHNDTHLLDLEGMCRGMDVSVYRGRYAGPDDLKGFKGIIHIPYAWSNLALFEGWQRGLVYFIPTESMLLKLAETRQFFWSPPFLREQLHTSEWYDPRNSPAFMKFGSWEELKTLTHSVNLDSVRQRVKTMAIVHSAQQVSRWRTVFESLRG